MAPTDPSPVASPAGGQAPEQVTSRTDQGSVSVNGAATAPEWVGPLVRQSIQRAVWVVVLVAALILALWKMHSLVSMLLIALFFGIAMDPGVTHLNQSRGWSRGKGTAAIFGGVMIAMLVTVVVLIPGLVKASTEIGNQIPGWVTEANKTFGISIDNGRPPEQIGQDLKDWVENWAKNNASDLLGLAGSLLGLVFQLFTIATFACYFAANGPKLRSIWLRRYPPAHQRRLGWAIDTAVEQTGGYLYSRILLMVINGGLFFIAMLAVGVTWSIALPMAIFEGFVAEFIPTIGTYLGAAIPIIVTLGLKGLVPALILLVWILIYQQLENYFLSPKLSSRTMEINGGVAFGAALAGGSIGGPMGAFMAIPVAALITAFFKHYGRPYPLAYRSAYEKHDTSLPLPTDDEPQAEQSTQGS
jgi:predicted PurR-regulated permease PerM